MWSDCSWSAVQIKSIYPNKSSMTVINALALKPRFKTGFSPPASVSALDELFALTWRRSPQSTAHANAPRGVDARWTRTHSCQSKLWWVTVHSSRVMMLTGRVRKVAAAARSDLSSLPGPNPSFCWWVITSWAPSWRRRLLQNQSAQAASRATEPRASPGSSTGSEWINLQAFNWDGSVWRPGLMSLRQIAVLRAYVGDEGRGIETLELHL